MSIDSNAYGFPTIATKIKFLKSDPVKVEDSGSRSEPGLLELASDSWQFPKAILLLGTNIL